jgi:drug/metabolite transporter (DMT)-like permease
MNASRSAVRISHPILKGVLASLVASFIYSYAFALAIGGVRSPAEAAYTFFPALMALPLMSWFIVGVGILLGTTLPRVLAGQSRSRATLRGAVLGFGVGGAGGSLLAFLFTTGARRIYAYMALTMAAYISIWVAGFAHYYAPKEK